MSSPRVPYSCPVKDCWAHSVGFRTKEGLLTHVDDAASYSEFEIKPGIATEHKKILEKIEMAGMSHSKRQWARLSPSQKRKIRRELEAM